MTNTDDDERAAREWLKTAVCYSHQQDAIDARHRATILRMLDHTIPRGADVPDDVILAMHKAYDNVTLDICSSWRDAIDVLHAWRTAPPPVKKVECWAVVDNSGHIDITRDSKANALALSAGRRVVKLIEAADADQ